MTTRRRAHSIEAMLKGESTYRGSKSRYSSTVSAMDRADELAKLNGRLIDHFVVLEKTESGKTVRRAVGEVHDGHVTWMPA